MMSDVPWAVAWYGRHQCVWLTLTRRRFLCHQRLLEAGAGALLRPNMDVQFVSIVALRRITVGAVSSPWECCKIKFRRVSRSATRDRLLPDRLFLTTGNAGKRRNSSTPMPAQPARLRATPAMPAAFRRQSIPRPPRHNGALRVNRSAQTPLRHGELRSPRKIFASGNVRMRDPKQVEG